MAYQVNDWVQAPGKGGVLWVYGRVQNINPTPDGVRYYVDRGYLGQYWYGDDELNPAVTGQDPAEVEAIRSQLKKLAGRR